MKKSQKPTVKTTQNIADVYKNKAVVKPVKVDPNLFDLAKKKHSPLE